MLAESLIQEGDSAAYRSSAPTAHLLNSNIPPTDEESRHICVAIQEILQDTDSVTRRLHDSQKGNDHDTLTRRMRELDDLLALHKAVLSNVRTLPTEILQHIFVLSTTNPWTLSHVSKRWRGCATSCPSLWADLPEIHLSQSPAVAERQIAVLTAILGYSSRAPISLHISFKALDPFEGPVDDPHHIHPVVTFLFNHLERWRSVVLEIGPTRALNLSRLLVGRLPRLESATLRILHTRFPVTFGGDSLGAFVNAPHVTRLDILGICSANLPLPRSRLTSLVINMEESFDITTFKAFSNLETLDIRCRSVTSPHIEGTRHITLPRLRNLSASLQNGSHSAFLGSIHVPMVERLSVFVDQYNIFRDIQRLLLRSGQRSRPTLLHLEICADVRPVPGQLVDVLRLAPYLTHLSSTLPAAEDLEEFARLENGFPVLVPLLRSCQLDFRRAHAFQDWEPLITDSIRGCINNITSRRCQPALTASPVYIQQFTLTGSHLEGYGFVHRFREGDTFRPHFTQADFEAAWVPSSGIDQLRALRDRLHWMIPEIYHSDLRGLWGWEDETLAVFGELERLEVVNPFDILLTDFHMVIDCLSCRRLDGDWYSYNPSRDAILLILSQARRILEKWKSIISPYLDDVHWVYSDLQRERFNAFTMMYVRPGHPLRSSPLMRDAVVEADLSSFDVNKPESDHVRFPGHI